MSVLGFVDGVCRSTIRRFWSTYGGWKVRNGGDKNVAGWDFKPIKGD